MKFLYFWMPFWFRKFRRFFRFDYDFLSFWFEIFFFRPCFESKKSKNRFFEFKTILTTVRKSLQLWKLTNDKYSIELYKLHSDPSSLWFYKKKSARTENRKMLFLIENGAKFYRFLTQQGKYIKSEGDRNGINIGL